MQAATGVSEKYVLVIEDGAEKSTPGCPVFGSAFIGMLKSCLDSILSRVEQRYRAQRVTQEEWVVVEIEPEHGPVRTCQPSSQSLLLDLPDTDEE